MHFELDNTFYATVALAVFLGLMAYFGVPKIIGKLLDGKIKAIADELAAARRLREEAAALLVEYEHKRIAAESEAAGIIAAAQAEAVRLAADAKTAMADLVARRTRSVEDKIAQAEAQAVAEVRARSADVAIEAARRVLVQEMPRKNSDLVNKAIGDVAARLN